MAIKIVKFGGSSLADSSHFKQVAQIIHADPARRYVIPSAPGKRFGGDTKITDRFYHCYELIRNREDATEEYRQIEERYCTIIKELGLDFDISGELAYIRSTLGRSSGRDYAASRGEYINGLILAKYLGFDFIDAENVIFFREDGTFDAETTNAMLAEELKKHTYAVIPGFYGSMPNGTIKTFSRGGSDVTGSIVARAAGADLYENWTDVSGFMMADPRVVNASLPMDTITYRELRELSYMGAGVLHDEATFPVRSAGIPINIRNTNAPEERGTMIVPDGAAGEPTRVITGVAGKKGFSVLNIEKDMMNSEIGFWRKLLDVLEEYEIPVEHLPSGIDTVSVVVPTAAIGARGEKLVSAIYRVSQADRVELMHGLSLVAVVGRGMVKARGTAARVCRAVSDAGINLRMIDQGSSELNIILGVDEADYETAVRAIFHEFTE